MVDGVPELVDGSERADDCDVAYYEAGKSRTPAKSNKQSSNLLLKFPTSNSWNRRRLPTLKLDKSRKPGLRLYRASVWVMAAGVRAAFG